MARVEGREHGTTNEVPSERFEPEKLKLRALPSSSTRVRQRQLIGRMSNDAFVDVDTVRYSVPHGLFCTPVEVEFDLSDERVRVYDCVKRVADHGRARSRSRSSSTSHTMRACGARRRLRRPRVHSRTWDAVWPTIRLCSRWP